MINSVCFLEATEPLKLYYLQLLVWLTTVECPWHFCINQWENETSYERWKKNIGKMSITETHAQRADQTLKANTRKRKVASAGGWRQVPKSDPHYQELVYIVPTSLPPPQPPYPPLDSTIYKIKNFLYSRFHSAVPPNLQGQTTQVITNKWSEVNKKQSPN